MTSSTERVVRLRTSVITSGSQPQVKLRWLREEAQRGAITQQSKQVLGGKVSGSAKLVLSSFDSK